MVRQPYSVAVLSTGGRLHPRFLRKRGLGRKWSSLWLKGDGGIRKSIRSNHPITYQRYKKGNRHTAHSIRNIPHDYRSNRTTHYRHGMQLRFKKFHQSISNSTIDYIRRLFAMHHSNNNHFIPINQIKNHIWTNIEMSNLNTI